MLGAGIESVEPSRLFRILVALSVSLTLGAVFASQGPAGATVRRPIHHARLVHHGRAIHHHSHGHRIHRRVHRLALVTVPTVTYSSIVTVPAPPSANFSGANGGGDGWAIGLTSTQVFNVFHHSGMLQVNCHNQSDASKCWSGPKTITDVNGHNFATSSAPGLWVDQASGHLFVFATRTSDLTAGVVCIDTTQPATTTDPFCGFTALSAVGDAPFVSGFAGISDPVVVGSRWYAFNVGNVIPTGTRDTLLCFELTSLSACPSQPFSVGFGSGTVSDPSYPLPAIGAIGDHVIIPIHLTAAPVNRLACFDTTTGGACAGSWPLSITASAGGFGAPFPLLSSTGAPAGVCIPSSGDPCFDLTGATVATPSGLAMTVTPSLSWNGPAVVIGPRVYLPNESSGKVDCFDYSASASCANFPKAFLSLGGLYTVNLDPQRPTCIWVNADNGAEQIQNFDAYSGGPCGQAPVRVLASVAVAPGSACTPATWTSLQVLTPVPANYTSATVDFEDIDGNPIPGTSTATVDATGTVNLTGTNLSTLAGSLPQFVITFTGAPANLSQVEVKLVWTGTSSPQCAPKTGITLGPPTGSQILNSNYTLTATAQDNGAPATGSTVTFTATSGPNVGKIVTGTTDASGNATATYRSAATGTDTWVATFVDNNGQTQASNEATITWTTSSLITTALSYGGATSVLNGGSLSVSGVLTSSNPSPGTPLGGKTVVFTLGSGPVAQTCSATTDVSGNASCSIASVNQTIGSVPVTAKFAGDTSYLPASASSSVSVMAPTAVGAFVIGDVTAGNPTIGNAVTFWGAQWAKSNAFSGGGAPSSMKGFVDDPTSFICGATWTSRPGNSSSPPANLPSQIDVIVSTKVTKSGSTISGKILHIVVVQVNPGYGPNPGHGGNGKITGTIC